jgi:uridine monophosphate synthetase
VAQPFFEFLEQRCREIDSLLCVGLDPHADELPERSAAAARDFCLRLIEATAEFAAAFKPNSAFFEAYGADGMQALKDVIRAVPSGIPLILDAKRGDIGSSSQAYAQAAFDELGAHALTVSPYLGKDSLSPLIANPANGIFILCKTSNPGAADVQDLIANREPVYMQVARLAESLNASANVGIVVGATYPEALAELRREVADLWFLAPGVGAQGGDLAAAVAAGIRPGGLGILIPISRAISKHADPHEAAGQFREAINAARKQKQPAAPSFPHARLADDLLRLGCVKFGDFKLKSGQTSPIYLDLRRLVGDPTALARAAAAYVGLLEPLQFDRLAALPYAALPIAAAISLQGGWPLVYPRKESKDYGTKSAVEGVYESGETVVVIDDLVTTGESKFEGIEKLEAAGLKVNDVVVLIDRQPPAADAFSDRGLKLHAALSLPDLLVHWKAKGAITDQQYAATLSFLQRG